EKGGERRADVDLAGQVLVVEHPLRLEVLDNGDFGVDRRSQNGRSDRLQLATFLSEFLEAPPGDVVVVENAVPVLFGAAARGAPSEMNDAVGAMSDRLHRPQPCLARTRRAQEIRLARRP